MSLHKLLSNQSGQFWGGFLGGLNQSMKEGRERSDKHKELELRKKQIDAQIKGMDADNEIKQHTLKQSMTKAAHEAEFAMQAGGGMVPGGPRPEIGGQQAEGPSLPDGSFGSPQPKDPLRAAAARVNPQAAAASLFDKPGQPQLVGENHIGSLQGGEFKPFPGRPDSSGMSAAVLKQLYGLDDQTASNIASLPLKAREQTIDNLRAERMGKQQNDQFNQREEMANKRHQSGLDAADVREDRRAGAQSRRQETGLRGEHQRQSKNFINQRNSLAEIEATLTGSAMSDHALIFKYLKVLDPTSTVRESEFETVRDTTGLPDRVKNYLNQVWKGQKLNPKQRLEIVEQSKASFGVARRQQDVLDTEYRRLAAGQGVDPDRVVLDQNTPDKPSSIQRSAKPRGITQQEAVTLVREAGGDKDKAREMARKLNLQF